MAVISDSKTASEMRAEVVHELTRQYEMAIKSASRRTGKGRTQKSVAHDQGYASALMVQIDFWSHVWVEGKQSPGSVGL